jgi:hypothetical protein
VHPARPTVVAYVDLHPVQDAVLDEERDGRSQPRDGADRGDDERLPERPLDLGRQAGGADGGELARGHERRRPGLVTPVARPSQERSTGPAGAEDDSAAAQPADGDRADESAGEDEDRAVGQQVEHGSLRVGFAGQPCPVPDSRRPTRVNPVDTDVRCSTRCPRRSRRGS